ncbi:hypothetical protein diail_6786 [Diaporthe ilicicola]|nr:hypothetical protein diail_6786 [Diaporthe ilicicola]
MAFFYHAKVFIINHVATASDPADFWYRYAMLLSHGSISLGNADFSKHEVLKSELAAIEKYNAAIAYVHENSHSMDAYGIMVCCVVFVGIKNPLGRYQESNRHLRAGSQLLPPALTGPEKALSRVIYQLGQDVAIYNGDDVLDGLADRLWAPDMSSRQEPFSTYDEASNMLLRLDIIYDAAFSSPIYALGALYASNALKRSTQRYLSVARHDFYPWSQRFELLQRSDDSAWPQQPPQEVRREPLVSLHQAVWAALVKMDTLDDSVAVGGTTASSSRGPEGVTLMYASGHGAPPVFTLEGRPGPRLCADLRVVRRRGH